MLVWFVFPMVSVVGLHSQLYDNGRQLYFILPPLFLGAGMTLDKLLARVRPLACRAAVAVISCIAGNSGRSGFAPV